ncbi:MAG: pyrroline-5-carboxylate reductase [Bradymonadia bacterium]|jgi:pyrroline-5-carboxylate reductase
MKTTHIKLGLLGCGKMGTALVKGISSVHNKDIEYYYFDVIETSMNAMAELLSDCVAKAVDSAELLWQFCDIIILAVKPKDITSVLISTSHLPQKPLLISLIVGLSHDKLTRLSNNTRCVCVMPNTPALVGEGVFAIEDKRSTSAESKLDYEAAEKLLNTCGRCYYLETQEQMNAAVALSGSSPAFFAVIVEALVDAGVAEGLPRDLALALARDTMRGTAKLLQINSPMKIKADVMSPAGTTAAGIIALERAGLVKAVLEYTLAVTEKSRSIF